MNHWTRVVILGSIAVFVGATAYAQTGADVYKAKCQMCHAADGSGNTPAGKAMKAVSFNSPQVVKKSDADLIAIVKNGRGKMPAFEGKLTDAQIEAVVAYIRTLQKKQ